MPAPSAYAVRVPFYYTASRLSNKAVEGDDETDLAADLPVFITHVTIEAIAFGERFFWLHVSENSTAQPQVPRLGSCSVSVGLDLSGCSNKPTVSSSQLMEFEATRLQDLSAGTNTSVQSVFATSLSQKLVRGVARQFNTQVTVYVNCAIEGDRSLSLLGTEGGTGFDKTFQFGTLVYREALGVIVKQLKSARLSA